ncbi:MAG: tetratricopeptide repeat protein [Ignavibacteriae bacterium]|nr:tetratricopeptide repeat protein [Ignavibacteriota bacterium]
MNKNKLHIFVLTAFSFILLFSAGCNYSTHRTLSKTAVTDTSYNEDPEPDYSVSLNDNYQGFVSFMFMGNRSETFSTFFNKFFTANEDYDEALKEYKLSAIATFNRRLDSLNITPPASQSTKDKLTKVIERCSKVIQYNKNTKYLDDAVLLIGKSYFLMGEYLQAERKFNEFFSNLTSSELYDEALVYLGRTKYKLGKNQEGETILKNLLNTTDNSDIKSQIYQTLANLDLSQKNFTGAHANLEKSIEFSIDKESKAERQYILAKVYTIYEPDKAPQEYRNAFKNTSDFDLEFYAKLNEAKALNILNDHRGAFTLLTNINKKYIDYPEYKQLIELEIANTYFAMDDIKTAKICYFDVIVKYPGTKSAADAYFHLAEYYEKDKNDYLKALISYKKVNETNAASDYSAMSRIKMETFDKYFALQAVVHDTTKMVIPAEEPELEKYKLQFEEKKNLNNKKENIQNKEQPGPKGGGNSGFSLTEFAKDTILKKDSVINPGIEQGDNTAPKDTLKDGSLLNPSDTTLINTENDSLKSGKENDSLKSGKENDSLKSGATDTLKTPVVNLDSVRGAKNLVKLNALFELAELFYYNLNQIDSTIFYLDMIINSYTNDEFVSKAMFYLGVIYSKLNDSVKAGEYFKMVIERYPKTVFSNEARIRLGLETKEISETNVNWDTALNYVRQAQILTERNEKDSALNSYKNILVLYPQSLLVSKVLFSIGWIYENLDFNKDSAESYYRKLKEFSPNSEYTASIASKLTYWESLAMKDSLPGDTTLQLKDSLGNNISDSVKIIGDSLKIPSDSLNIKPPPEKKNIPGQKTDDGSGDDNSGIQHPPKKQDDPKKIKQ